MFRQQHVISESTSAFGVPYSALLLGALTLWCCLTSAQLLTRYCCLHQLIVDFCDMFMLLVVNGQQHLLSLFCMHSASWHVIRLQYQEVNYAVQFGYVGEPPR